MKKKEKLEITANRFLSPQLGIAIIQPSCSITYVWQYERAHSEYLGQGNYSVGRENSWTRGWYWALSPLKHFGVSIGIPLFLKQSVTEWYVVRLSVVETFGWWKEKWAAGLYYRGSLSYQSSRRQRIIWKRLDQDQVKDSWRSDCPGSLTVKIAEVQAGAVWHTGD